MNGDITNEEREEYLAYHSYNDFFENLENGLENAQNECDRLEKKEPYILVCGAMIAFDKGLSNFLNVMNEKKGNLILLSEVTAENRRYTKNKIRFPFICTPHLLAKEMILLNMDIPITEEMEKLYSQKIYIQEAVSNLMARHPSVCQSYALAWSYYAFQYINILLENIPLQYVILWNKYYAFHEIFDGICKEKKIRVFYMEFGCIPGTISIERFGQQGESIWAHKYTKWLKNRILRSELIYSQNVIKYLKQSGLNRNIQPSPLFDTETLKILKNGKKNVLYIGQNDYESGLFPYTSKTRKKHSKSFKSTIEGLDFLYELCQKNDWNLLYKPHPIIESLKTEEESYSGYTDLHVLRNVNINHIIDHVDVVVTILSQTAYVSLIREKPVVMLGYTQLRNKGCCYEAYDKCKVESGIKKALRFGITRRQKKNFRVHVAILLKYYLWDDECTKECIIGREISKVDCGKEFIK